MVREGSQVVDANGLRGVVESVSDPLAEERVLVRFEGGQRVWLPAQVLHAQADGGYRLSVAVSELAARGGEVPQPSITAQTWVVPVLAEELAVDKRLVETGRVRVKKVVREHEEVVDVPLAQEQVSIERVQVNRVVVGEVPVRQQGDTLIVPLLEEVLVVEKRLMLREELHITRRRTEAHAPQVVTLRTEEAMVERVGKPGEEARDKGPA